MSRTKAAGKGYNRRRFIKEFAAAEYPRNARAMPKRNVVLYVTDDQGTNLAGCYGNPVIKTPGLDELAENGTRFTHGFCTSPSCSPSRAVILTGLQNHANGMYGLEHTYFHFSSFEDVKSLPVMLANAGYRTASIGKYHVAPEKVYHFQYYLKSMAPAAMAENCRPFIEQEAESPFFLYFCTLEPHRPFNRDGSDRIIPENVIIPPYMPDTYRLRQELAWYYGSIQRADSGLLGLIKVLKETGHWDDTLIIYVSDNGIGFPGAKTNLYDPGIRLPCVARNPYADKKGTVTDAMVSWTDITPTILDYAGLTPPDYKFHGRSFLPVIEKEHPEGWDEVYGSHSFHGVTMYYPMRMIRTRKYKLIWNIAHELRYPTDVDMWGSFGCKPYFESGANHFGKRKIEDLLYRPEFELYDMQQDPDEINNLAESPEHKNILEKLKAKIKIFQKNTDDPWIVKWTHE